jgi:hypothetical protein
MSAANHMPETPEIIDIELPSGESLPISEIESPPLWSAVWTSMRGDDRVTWTASLREHTKELILIYIVVQQPEGTPHGYGELAAAGTADVESPLLRVAARAGLEEVPDAWLEAISQAAAEKLG